jgi:hypothetical protein
MKDPVILSREKIDIFLQNVAYGFQTNFLEALIIVILVSAIVFLLVYYYKLYRKIQKGYLISGAERIWKKEINKWKLIPSEIALMDEFSAQLENPNFIKHRLFTDKNLFFFCQRKIIDKNSPFALESISMQVKLGFSGRKQGKKIRTTGDIPVNSLIYLQKDYPKQKKYHKGSDTVGEWNSIHSQSERRANSLRLKNIVEEGILVRLNKSSEEDIFFREGGTYNFISTIIGLRGNDYLLQHSRLIVRSEKRKLYRRNVEMFGFLESLNCRLLNLGGGGACIEIIDEQDQNSISPELLEQLDSIGGLEAINQEEKSFQFVFFIKSDYLDKQDSTDARKIYNRGMRIVSRVKIAGRSHLNNHLHLYFQKIRESDRDRIFRFLLAQESSLSC